MVYYSNLDAFNPLAKNKSVPNEEMKQNYPDFSKIEKQNEEIQALKLNVEQLEGMLSQKGNLILTIN